MVTMGNNAKLDGAGDRVCSAGLDVQLQRVVETSQGLVCCVIYRNLYLDGLIHDVYDGYPLRSHGWLGDSAICPKTNVDQNSPKC